MATMTDEDYMRLALEEARIAAEEGEVPIGAVVVSGGERVRAGEPNDAPAWGIRGGEVIARAHNRREADRDPSAHAEFSALCQAARELDRWRLTGCTVYVTLEPCLMCAGLMVNARIDRCVFGAPDPKGGALGTLYDVSHDERLNHEFEVTGGVLADECATELRSFFRARRARKAKPASFTSAPAAASPASVPFDATGGLAAASPAPVSVPPTGLGAASPVPFPPAGPAATSPVPFPPAGPADTSPAPVIPADSLKPGSAGHESVDREVH